MSTFVIDEELIHEADENFGVTEFSDDFTYEDFEYEYYLVVEKLAKHLNKGGYNFMSDSGGDYYDQAFTHQLEESLDDEQERINRRIIALRASDDSYYSRDTIIYIGDFILSLDEDYGVLLYNDLCAIAEEYGEDYFQIVILVTKNGVYGSNGCDAELHPFMEKLGFFMTPEAQDFILRTREEMDRLGL